MNFDHIAHTLLVDPMRGKITQEIESLEEFAKRLLMMPAVIRRVQHQGLQAACQIIEQDASDQIGHYQEQHGEFPAWAPLADSTEEEKARLGYPPDAPLLREGDLKNSFSHEVRGLEAVVGSTDPVMVYHEFGTSRMPPRPALGPALYKNREAIQKLLGFATVTAIIDGERADLTNHFGAEAHHFGGDI
jgi:phage gpG-like protein